MDYLVLLGILIVIVGFALKLDAILIIFAAAIVTALVGGIGVDGFLATLGSSFVSNRSMAVFIIILLVVGTLERNGLKEAAAALIGKESPLGMVLGSLLLGALQSGSVNLTVSTSVQAEIVNVIKGFVMLFATVNLLQYFRGAKKEAAK